DDAAAGVILLDPIADAAIAVGPVDRVAAKAAAEDAIDPDAALGALVIVELGTHFGDEGEDVLRGLRAVHPREPLTEPVAIALDGGEDGWSVFVAEEAHLDTRGGGEVEHGNNRSTNGPCGTDLRFFCGHRAGRRWAASIVQERPQKPMVCPTSRGI